MISRKIVLSVVLVAMFGGTAASAVDFKDYVLSNSTGAGAWTDPMSNKRYYTGGSVVFKFKDPQYYPLWADARPPSIKVGCGGISLDSGFLQLLGLEDMGQQLSDASGQAAYGVMLSLISSTPILARVFETIRKWARAIQGLAQNACEMGRKWGKDNLDYDVGKKIEEFGASDGGVYDQAMKGSDKYAEDLSNFVDQSLADGTTITNLIGGAIGVGNTNATQDTLINLAAQGGLSKMFLQYVTSNISKNKIAIGSTQKIFTDGIVTKDNTVLAPISMSPKLESDKLLFLAALRYYGTVLVSRSSIYKIENSLQDNGDFDKEALKQMLQSAHEGDAVVTPKTVAMLPSNVSAEKMVSELLDGVPAADSKVKVPDYLYIDIELDNTPQSTGGSTGSVAITPAQKKKVRLMFLIQPMTTVEMDFNFQGVRAEMRKAVFATVVNSGGSTTDSLGNTISSDLASINSLLAPKAFSGLGHYSRVIARMERNAGGATAESDALKGRVADLGSFIVVERLIRGIGAGLIAQLQSHIDDSGEDAGETQKQIKYINERTDKAIKIIYEKFEDTNLEEGLYKQIDVIEKDMDEQRTKKIR